MRKAVTFMLVVLVCGTALLASGPSHAEPAYPQYHMSWYVVGGGGEIGRPGGGQTLNGTIGQTAIGWSENGPAIGSGFWYGVDRGDLWEVYLPLVLRQLGSLEGGAQDPGDQPLDPPFRFKGGEFSSVIERYARLEG
jgi:hypothetical protein